MKVAEKSLPRQPLISANAFLQAAMSRPEERRDLAGSGVDLRHLGSVSGGGSLTPSLLKHLVAAKQVPDAGLLPSRVLVEGLLHVCKLYRLPLGQGGHLNDAVLLSERRIKNSPEGVVFL